MCNRVDKSTDLKRTFRGSFFLQCVKPEKYLDAPGAAFYKNIAMKAVYSQSTVANTTTITNIGNIKVEKEYEQYIKQFYAFIPMSKGQPMKGTICSYKDTLVFSFTSVLMDTMVQRSFFRKIATDGIEVTLETNGDYYE